MLKIFSTILNPLSVLIGKINWKLKDPVTDAEKDQLRALLEPNFFIILTRNSNHLSTYAIAFSDLVLRGKWGYWGHALMNTEGEVADDRDFRFIEAIGAGVVNVNFNEVFGVSSVALLKPKSMTADKWTEVIDKARTELGKPYDTVFDLTQDKKLSCVELVRTALVGEPNYETDFANFEAMIAKTKYLTPQMFYDCPDFEVVYEIRH